MSIDVYTKIKNFNIIRTRYDGYLYERNYDIRFR